MWVLSVEENERQERAEDWKGQDQEGGLARLGKLVFGLDSGLTSLSRMRGNFPFPWPNASRKPTNQPK